MTAGIANPIDISVVQPENTYDDLSLKEIPWQIGGKPYLLKEATEGMATLYESKRTEGMKFKDGQVVQFGAIHELQSYLVSLCLLRKHQVDGVDSWVPVDQATVKKWPSKLVKKLAAQARKISDLGEEETEESLEKRIASDQEKLARLRENRGAAKNGQPSSTES